MIGQIDSGGAGGWEPSDSDPDQMFGVPGSTDSGDNSGSGVDEVNISSDSRGIEIDPNTGPRSRQSNVDTDPFEGVPAVTVDTSSGEVVDTQNVGEPTRGEQSTTDNTPANNEQNGTETNPFAGLIDALPAIGKVLAGVALVAAIVGGR